MYVSHQFQAFDTDICIGIITNQKDITPVFDNIEQNAKIFDFRFSRFNPGSELNAINNANGHKIEISDEMSDLLKKAKEFYKNTKGFFDPTILASLKNIGYNKSFPDTNSSTEKSKSTTNFLQSVKSIFAKRAKFDTLKITKNTITAPKGFILDLGGIAKGYWVDKIAKILDQHFQNYWISAGGDIYLKGRQENGKLWETGVQNPANLNEDILTLKTPAKGLGIATSGITKRHGIKNNFEWHHLINSRTGLPIENSILAVTAIANSTIKADVMAKTILFLGIEKGLALINNMRDYSCVITDKNLKIHTSKGLKKFL